MAYVPVPKDLSKVKTKVAFNFLVAMYEKHGQPLEVVIKNIIQTKLTRPKVRPYQTENLYALLEKQRALEKEVSAIVKRTDKKDAGNRRKQA